MKKALSLSFLIHLLILWFFLSRSFAGEFYTLADLKAGARDQTYMTTEPTYADSVWNRWVNEGSLIISRWEVIEKIDTIVWTANTQLYAPNSDFLNLKAVGFVRPSGKTPPTVVPNEQIFLQKYSDELTPRYAYSVGSEGSARVGFYPPPARVDTTIVIYWASAKALSASTDTSNIPLTLRPAIVSYVSYKALLRYSKNAAFAYLNEFDSYHNQVLREKGLATINQPKTESEK
jgi:hypothetical protein